MAGGISTRASGVWLPALFGIGAIPQQYYVGLVTAEPRGNDTGTSIFAIEPSGSAYRRQLYSIGPSWWQVTGGSVSNKSAVTFPTPLANWGYITHFVLCSAQNFGDLFAWGVLQNPQNVVQDVPPRFPAGAMILTMPASS